MNKRMISFISFLFLIILATTMLASCGSSSTAVPATTSSSGSASNGQTLMQTRCTVCHPLDRVTSSHKTADEWKTTVDRMINNGAQLSPSEAQTLISYLAQNYK